MSFFKKPAICIWPKSHSLEIFINKKENNYFVFEFDLWQKISDQDATSLHDFFKTISGKNIYLLLPEEVSTIKSFVYESNIDSLNKDEVVAMLSAVIDFKVDPNLISYKLEDSQDKTIIRVAVTDGQKINILKHNLEKIGIKITDYQPVSVATVNTVSQFYDKTYSLIYPLDPPRYLFILAKDRKIFLTDTIKGVSLDVKKKINYSKLYFGKTTDKLFLPSDFQIDLKVNDKIEKSPFDETKISNKFSKSSNLPLSVLSFFNRDLYKQIKQTVGIIKIPNLENLESKIPKMEHKQKKNSLIILLVFIASLSVVTALLWFLLNKQDAGMVSPSSSNQTPTPEITQPPTPTPTPLAELNKNLKIKVLNATDINGQAAKVKNNLVSLEFEDISVGNSSEDISKNTVKYKAGLEGVPAYVSASLPGFGDADFQNTLKETDTYDIIIMIGQDLSSTPSPSPSPSQVPTQTKPKDVE